MFRSRFAHPLALALLTLVTAPPSHAAAKRDVAPSSAAEYQARWMSPMGARAAGLPHAVDPDAPAVVPPAAPFAPPALRAMPGLAAITASGIDVPVHTIPAAGTQAEPAIATNTAGSVIVVGFNDSRGLPAPGVTTYSLSGVARSSDGGQTWFDVPVGPGGQSTMPTVTNGQIYGDPDVKYDPIHNVFIYSSIYVRPADGLQGVCVNVSNADGSSWSAPHEVTPTFVNGHAGDKPFIDVNPATGRILVSWTDFTSTTSSIRKAYSDNQGTTWSSALVLTSATGTNFVQASEPRFLPGATNATSTVYDAWETGGTTTRNVGMSRSTDGGTTWSAAVNIDAANFAPEDEILGVDRVNASPSLAIDPATGRVYVAYQANNATGTGDIAMRSFIGMPAGGARSLLDADPGNDRAQFMPAVCVDASTGRVHLVWYDQGAHATGDVIELMHTSSADQGATWSRPAPLFDRPYHAGYGNDPGEPNLGDYLEAVATNGVLHTVGTNTSEVETFDEGLPGGALYSPDVYHDAEPDNAILAALRLGAVTFTEACAAQADGALDPGETAAFTFPLRNYVGNAAVGAATYHTVSATLVPLTAGVTVLAATQSYADIAPLTTVANAAPFEVSLDPAFPPGADAILRLDVTTDQGTASLRYRLETGTPGPPTVLINENFEGVVVPALPAGWASMVGGTSTNDPWVTTSSAPGGYGSGKWAFHAETTTQEFMRLWSPVVTVPSATNAAVTLDFDLAYSTEVEATQSVTAYDGLTLRITDETGGTAIRSVLAEAFADAITTGTSEHFPRHLPRSSSTNYFPDMSVWAGNSGGVKHVSIRFPGAGLTGRKIQLRFEYTQDASGTCTGNGFPTPCGVGIDNVQLRLVPATAGFTRATTSTAVTSDVNPSTTGQTVTLSATVAPGSASGTVEFFDGVTSLGTAPVAGGTASLPVSTLTAGSHSITATYAGDACDATSTSPAYAQQERSVRGG